MTLRTQADILTYLYELASKLTDSNCTACILYIEENKEVLVNLLKDEVLTDYLDTMRLLPEFGPYEEIATIFSLCYTYVTGAANVVKFKPAKTVNPE